MKDFSFQCKVYLGARLAGGLPGALRWVGDAPKCDVSLATEKEDRKESYSGQRLTSATLQTGKSATIAMTLNWADGKNLVLGVYGTELTVTSGTITDEALPTGLVAGDLVALPRDGSATASRWTAPSTSGSVFSGLGSRRAGRCRSAPSSRRRRSRPRSPRSSARTG